MKIEIKPVKSLQELMVFIKLPWQIYKNNRNWVPPLISDMKNTLNRKNPAFLNIEFEMFLAFKEGQPAGRIFVGIDKNLNQRKNLKMGYFALLETIEDFDVFFGLMDAAINWLKDKNINLIKGPVSPFGVKGDEYKGLLINAYDMPPVFMNSYNPPYYKSFIERYGFEKDYDLYAYYLDPKKLFAKDPKKILEYAQKKYNFYLKSINLKAIDREVLDLKKVIDLSVPDEWEDLVPPSLEEIKEMAKKLKPFADPDLIVIARSQENPIGFGLALPDYNEVLIHMKGKLTPFSIAKFLWYRKKIKGVRFFTMFVVPEFRQKGVSYAIYYQTFLNGLKKNYSYGEGSTIGEDNLRMRKDIESLGGIHYKTYRIYKKLL
ncbi:MAG: N-acetyltransferase [Caldanaerobacter sp.]